MEAWYNVRDVASDAKVPKVMSMVTIKRFLSKAIAVMRGPLCVDNGFVSSSDWQAGCEEASMILPVYIEDVRDVLHVHFVEIVRMGI